MKIGFAASKGHWGEHGMVRISFWKWLWLVLDGGYVTKVRVMRKGPVAQSE